jgi:hypothetical protein
MDKSNKPGSGFVSLSPGNLTTYEMKSHVKYHQHIGEKQYTNFKTERLEGNKSFNDPNKKNFLKTFGSL